MIGPLLIAISWLLLRIEGKTLTVLGLNAPRLRLMQFTAGFLIAALIVVAQQLGASLATDVAWQRNAAFDASAAFESLRWNLNSVLYEELIFRGYLLYQAIRWLGEWRGVLLGAAAFAIYHWFSYGIFGNWPMMIVVFVYTGGMGIMFALAFAKTQSIAAPIGLHLGWNVISYTVFSTGPLGAAWWIPANGAARMEASGLPGFMFDVGLPVLLVTGVCGYLLRGPQKNLCPAQRADGLLPDSAA